MKCSAVLFLAVCCAHGSTLQSVSHGSDSLSRCDNIGSAASSCGFGTAFDTSAAAGPSSLYARAYASGLSDTAWSESSISGAGMLPGIGTDYAMLYFLVDNWEGWANGGASMNNPVLTVTTAMGTYSTNTPRGFYFPFHANEAFQWTLSLKATAESQFGSEYSVGGIHVSRVDLFADRPFTAAPQPYATVAMLPDVETLASLAVPAPEPLYAPVLLGAYYYLLRRRRNRGRA